MHQNFSFIVLKEDSEGIELFKSGKLKHTEMIAYFISFSKMSQDLSIASYRGISIASYRGILPSCDRSEMKRNTSPTHAGGTRTQRHVVLHYIATDPSECEV